jgi:hypothetical protein
MKTIRGAGIYGCMLPPCPWCGPSMLTIQGLTLNRLQHRNYMRSYQQRDYIDILSAN